MAKTTIHAENFYHVLEPFLHPKLFSIFSLCALPTL